MKQVKSAGERRNFLFLFQNGPFGFDFEWNFFMTSVLNGLIGFQLLFFSDWIAQTKMAPNRMLWMHSSEIQVEKMIVFFRGHGRDNTAGSNGTLLSWICISVGSVRVRWVHGHSLHGPFSSDEMFSPKQSVDSSLNQLYSLDPVSSSSASSGAATEIGCVCKWADFYLIQRRVVNVGLVAPILPAA